MSESSNESQVEEVKFHFIKSNQFRTVSCDGIMGVVGPDYRFHLHPYCERAAIPKEVTMKSVDGELVDQISQEGLTGFVREIECNLVLDVGAAIELHQWLEDRLDEITEELRLDDDENDDEQLDEIAAEPRINKKENHDA